MKKESAFETHFGQCSTLFRMLYIKVPDMIPTRERLATLHKAKEALKPFDGILITPTNAYCLEFKYGYGKQSPNQRFTEDRINKIRPHAYYVVRKTEKGLFRIEQSESILFETDHIEDLVSYFKNIECSAQVTAPVRRDKEHIAGAI